jgi:hypothetical protein
LVKKLQYEKTFNFEGYYLIMKPSIRRISQAMHPNNNVGVLSGNGLKYNPLLNTKYLKI